MKTEELLNTLKSREKALLVELHKIQSLISIYEGEPDLTKVDRKQKVKPTAPVVPEGIAKDDSSWDAYTITVLKEIGGKGTAHEVSDYVLRANPKMEKDTVLNNIRGWLSRHSRDGKIGAKKGKSKNQGSEYYILESAGGLFSAE